MLAHHQTIEEADEDKMSGQEDTTDEDHRKIRRKEIIGKNCLSLWPFATKLIEMLFACVASVIMTDGELVLYSYTIGEIIMELTVSGTMLACCTLVIVYILGEDHHIPELISTLLYGVLNFLTAVLFLIEKSLHEGRGENYTILAIICFLNGGISAFCIGMIVEPIRKSTIGTRYTYQLLLIYTTYLGFLVTLAILLLGRLFGDRFPYKTNALFSIIGAFLNLATGCLILIDRIEFSTRYIFYPNMYLTDMMCLSGAFAIVNMFVYAIDAIFTIKLRKDL